MALKQLYDTSCRVLPRLGNWTDCPKQNLFMIAEDTTGIRGALLAWPDESPVAWVRLGVLDNALPVEEWFDLLWPAVETGLRKFGAESVLWMDRQEWVAAILRQREFRQFANVTTLTKVEASTPGNTGGRARLRPATAQDIDKILSIDHRAFTPHWWHGKHTIRDRITQAISFTVALQNETIVAYAEADISGSNGHINRIAVEPERQSQGIGALLLQNTLTTLWQHHVDSVTINTQRDNLAALRLYREFGFAPTGDTVTIWEYKL
ncbi:MAG: GNAT family N-acetyltransferase [Anaerolineae bacterium]|nr:GNAT family N-acetyltransferase [Anaerolineae bacterium]